VAVYDIHSVSSPYLSPGYSDEMFGVGLVANAYVHSASWGAVGNTYNHRDKDFDQFLYKNDRYLLVIAGGNYGSGDNPGSVLNVGKNVVTGELLLRNSPVGNLHYILYHVFYYV